MMFLALLPDGQIFGQISQRGPKKCSLEVKKLEALKLQNLAKVAEKRPEYIFTLG
jgi:hypothetical protein